MGLSHNMAAILFPELLEAEEKAERERANYPQAFVDWYVRNERTTGASMGSCFATWKAGRVEGAAAAWWWWWKLLAKEEDTPAARPTPNGAP